MATTIPDSTRHRAASTVRAMSDATIRSAYSKWPDYNRRLRDVIAGLTAEQLALQPAPERWPLWATLGHTFCQRVFWLCDFAGEPGADTTRFTNAGYDCPGDDDLEHVLSAADLVEALDSTFRIVERCLDTWTVASLDEVLRRPEWDASWVHTRARGDPARVQPRRLPRRRRERRAGRGRVAAGRPLGLGRSAGSGRPSDPGAGRGARAHWPMEVPMHIKDKVIAVTGAGNGVGRAVTLEALRRGARVAAVDVSAAGLEETVRLAASRRPALDPRRRHHGPRGRRGAARRDCRPVRQRRRPRPPRGDHPAVPAGEGPRRRDDRSGDRGQLVGHAQPEPGVPAGPARAARGPHRQHLEHGRLHPCARPDDLRRVEGGGEAPHRGALRRVPRDARPRDGRDPRRHGDEHAGQLRRRRSRCPPAPTSRSWRRTSRRPSRRRTRSSTAWRRTPTGC